MTQTEISTLLKRIEGIANANDWYVEIELEDVYYDIVFRHEMSNGIDNEFGFNIKMDDNTYVNIDDISQYIQICFDEYDISFETMFYLDKHGHGVKGFPYRMIDVYAIFEEFASQIERLADEFRYAADCDE